MLHRLLVVFATVVLIAAGCGPDDTDPHPIDPDAGVGADAESADASPDAVDEPDAGDEPDADTGDDVGPDPADLEACGGEESPTYDGAPAEPGDSCGECGDGTLVCDGPDALTCVGATEQNECGGCQSLFAEPGAECGPCEEGTWECTAEGGLACDGSSGRNDCGGCDELEGALGAACTTEMFEFDGVLQCTSQNEMTCSEDPDAMENPCGGPNDLSELPGEACGTCGFGTLECDSIYSTECIESDRGVNACGGCGPLVGEPGEECGDCGGTWSCEGDNRVICAQVYNECGGCSELDGAPGDSCEGGVMGCASTDELTCFPDATNACGGTEMLDGIPGEDCGPCEEGVRVCAGLDTLSCIGAAEPNDCGGCGPLPGEEGQPCDEEHGLWACTNDGGMVCEPLDLDTNACGGTEELEAQPTESCGPCDMDIYQCDGPDEVVCNGETPCVPPPPAPVNASDGDWESHVEIEWSASETATFYRVYRDGEEIDMVSSTGDDTYSIEDHDAHPGLVPDRPSNVQLEETPHHVELTWEEPETSSGPAHHYEVVAHHATGGSDPASDTGWRAPREITDYEVATSPYETILSIYWDEIGIADSHLFDDVPAPSLSPGEARASQADFTDRVRLENETLEFDDGTDQQFAVRAINESGAGNYTSLWGRRTAGELQLQWQRSEGESAEDFSNLQVDCADELVCDDTTLPEGESRWYRLRIDAEGVEETTYTDEVEGWLADRIWTIEEHPPSTLAAGETFEVEVQLRGPDETPVEQEGVPLALTLNQHTFDDGSQTVDTTTGADGSVTEELRITSAAEDYEIRAESLEAATDTTSSFDVEPDGPYAATSSIHGEFLGLKDDGHFHAGVDVEIYDQFENPVPGESVDYQATPGDYSDPVEPFGCPDTDDEGRSHCRITTDGAAVVDLELIAPVNIPSHPVLVGPDFWTPDGTVHTVEYHDERIWVGGDFSHVGPLTGAVAGVDAVGEWITPTWPVVDGTVEAIESDDEGGWFIGGEFDLVGDHEISNLARIDADGNVDPDFQASPTPNPLSTIERVGGELFVDTSGVVGIDIDTGEVTFDPQFESGQVSLSIHEIVEDDGELFVVGDFATVDGYPREHVVSFDLTSGDVTGWAPDVSSPVRTLAIGEEAVYLGGMFGYIDGESRQHIGAVDRQTGEVTGWAPDAPWPFDFIAGHNVHSLEVTDDSVYVGGSFEEIGGEDRHRLAEVDKETGHATDWDPASPRGGVPREIHVNDDSVVIAGSFDSLGSESWGHIAELDRDTGEPGDWHPAANDDVFDFAVDGDELYAVGDFYIFGGAPDRIWRSSTPPTGGPTTGRATSTARCGRWISTTNSTSAGRSKTSRDSSATGSPPSTSTPEKSRTGHLWRMMPSKICICTTAASSSPGSSTKSTALSATGSPGSTSPGPR